MHRDCQNGRPRHVDPKLTYLAEHDAYTTGSGVDEDGITLLDLVRLFRKCQSYSDTVFQ